MLEKTIADNKEIASFLGENRCFYVNCVAGRDDTVLLAFKVSLDMRDRSIKWLDSNMHERWMSFSELVFKGDCFEFTRNSGVVYKFSPLDLKIYNKMVRPAVFDKKSLASEEELEKIIDDFIAQLIG